MRIRKSLLKGMSTGAPLVFSAFFFGIIFGFTGGMGQLPLHFVSSMSWVIFAGSAQFITLILLLEEELFFAIIITAILINLRHLLYGAALHHDIKAKGLQKMLIAYLLTDEAFLVTAIVRSEEQQKKDKQYTLEFVLIGVGLLLWASWNIATILGYFLQKILSELITLPPNFVISASFVGFLVEQWVSTSQDRTMMLFTGIMAIVLGLVLSSSFVLISIMVTGAVYAMIAKYLKSQE